MATTSDVAQTARELASEAAYTVQQQTAAVAALTDQANNGRRITRLEATALVDLIGDLRRAAAAAVWLDDREAGEAA